MRGFAKFAAAVAAVALIAFGVGFARTSHAADGIKSLMGDNFQNVQVILIDLVTAQYQDLPAKIQVIHQHAVDLPKKMPNTVKTEAQRRMFVNYAYQLENNTSNMLTVLDALIQHDKTASEPGKLNIDYLRVVAARQFGEIVTSCVLCHNEFRRYVVK
ncbi:MAG TPA: hypothetical protein VKB51_03040 [bacterium]|nr:hypothetical protein [bacterium]